MPFLLTARKKAFLLPKEGFEPLSYINGFSMESFLRSGSLKIAKVWGIPIRVHFSWLMVFGVISWSLSTFYFPEAAPELPASSYWITGVVASLLLFVSVIFHELAHSFVALRYRLSIISITLFIFGGVAQMKGEPPNPESEFKIALAGPVISFMLAFIFLLSFLFSHNIIIKALFQYLAQLNFILGVFNLIPGFPMDGGRVVRAYIWKKKGDFFNATRKASNYGQKIAFFFIVLGLFLVFIAVPSGLWLMVIGWFLYSAAQSSYQQASLQETLSGISVKDIMVRDIVSLPPDISLDIAVNLYFLRYGFGGFPVIEGDKLYGFVTLKEVRDISRDKWQYVKVSQVCKPLDKKLEVSEKDSAMHALELMINEDAGRLIVREGERIVGLITRNGIAQYVQIMGR